MTKEKPLGLQPGEAPNFTDCPYWGQGGRYVVVDGKRVPAPPEEPVPETPVAVVDAAPASDASASTASAESQPNLKGKRNG